MNDYSRILSAMRPTGRLHIGHYHGVIKNWVELQYEHDCYFMVADLHALTSNYENTKDIEKNIHNMVVDWLACGVDPSQAIIFIQSQVPEHSELYTLLSMITPLSWLLRVPSYKDMLERLSSKELDTYGFLGYPLLQSADILLYQSKFVPVGEDQVIHVELTREIARRFNHIYGREPGFEQKAMDAMKKLGKKKSELYQSLLVNYQQNGDDESLEKARFLLSDAINLSLGERERLFAFLENKSRVILTEPQAIVTDAPKIMGVDGQKMSKSFNNTIMLQENLDSMYKKIREMPTDPARVRRTDKGDPLKCPVWQLHIVYSDENTKRWAKNGCVSAGIGCLECKTPLIDSIEAEQVKFHESAKAYTGDTNLIKNILADGAEKASEIAKESLEKIKQIMNISY